MLKRKLFRRIIVATGALFALFLIYLIPRESATQLNNINQNLEYTFPNVLTSPIFLIDSNNFLAKAEVVVSTDEVEEKVKELVQILIKDGIGSSRVPSGFKAIIPSETKILSIEYENNLVKIDFSKELLEVKKELEEKVIEAIVFTVTSVDEVEKVIIYVEGEVLTKLPQTGINLPSTLDRSFGINKTFSITSRRNINHVTVYFLNKHNDNYYYVPVTKFLNDDRNKINIIIDQLTSSPIHNTNLMSFLNNQARLLAANEQSDMMELTFNSYIFSDFEQRKILEEVTRMISLSIKDTYNISTVSFIFDEQEIYKSVLKPLNN